MIINVSKAKVEINIKSQQLTADGLKPDPLMVKVIRYMPSPTSEAELETVLGKVNYLARFAPNVADLCVLLRHLIRQETKFKSETTHENAFQKMKEIITEGPVLAYFNSKKGVIVQVDESKHGLGSTCMQEGRPA